MLRSANDALRAHKVASATSVAVLAFALVIPCAVILAGAFASDAAQTYLAAYQPVVYLSADADKDAAADLAAELDDWSQVGEARLRTPSQAFEDLEERLGPQEVAKLGVSAHMLPYSVILVPSTPVVGHLDLIARVSGLEARMEVASVDVPSPKAARTLSFVRWVLFLGVGLLALLVVAGVSQARGFLVRLADEQQRETALLSLFGAPPQALRRPTLVRGFFVGLWAGVAAFAILMAVLLLWQSARPVVLGVSHGLSGWSWVVVAAPLIVGPLAGLIAGWLANRSLDNTREVDELELQTLVSLR